MMNSPVSKFLACPRVLVISALWCLFTPAAYAATMVIDFESFSSGDVITNQIPGVTVSASGGSGDAMIFDTDINPATGNDTDLTAPFTGINGEPELSPGKVLIISEDGDTSDPDDNASGGVITFQFSSPVTINSMDIFDAHGGDRVLLDGGLIGVAGDSDTDNPPNAYETLFFAGSGFGTTLSVHLVDSGAIDNISISTPIPGAIWLFGSALAGLIGIGHRRRNAAV